MLVAFGQFLDHDMDHVPLPRSKSKWFYRIKLKVFNTSSKNILIEDTSHSKPFVLLGFCNHPRKLQYSTQN
jgi:hypothetical protein